MLICDQDLYDISACLMRIRNDPTDPFNETVVNQLLYVLHKEIASNVFVFNSIRSAVSTISNLDKEKWYFAFHENVYVHFAILKDEKIYNILIKALSSLKQVIAEGNKDKIDDLADCLHCLPDIIAENRFKITKSYWKTHVQYYRKKWDKDFLLQEQKKYF